MNMILCKKKYLILNTSRRKYLLKKCYILPLFFGQFLLSAILFFTFSTPALATTTYDFYDVSNCDAITYGGSFTGVLDDGRASDYFSHSYGTGNYDMASGVALTNGCTVWHNSRALMKLINVPSIDWVNSETKLWFYLSGNNVTVNPAWNNLLTATTTSVYPFDQYDYGKVKKGDIVSDDQYSANSSVGWHSFSLTAQGKQYLQK
jgi:hypothetical protein